MKSLTQILTDSLGMLDAKRSYYISQQLAYYYSEYAVVETEDYDFDPLAYAKAGLCNVIPLDSTHAQVDLEWMSKVQSTPIVALLEVHWQGHQLYLVRYPIDCGRRYCILAPLAHVAEQFFAKVCRWNTDVQGSILIFQGGMWRRDDELKKQIASAKLESLVLPKEFEAELLRNFEDFFASKELYDKYGIAWKRGVLLFGPPGNGKTHAIKALVNRLNVPCLYVRSFKSYRGTIHQNIERVFSRARASAPCILVMEDLDSLVDRDNLSFFLNELDGFASNNGILTVATTNHPEKLDIALLERPSRFDRKLTFELPKLEERLRFLMTYTACWEADLRLSEDEYGDVAAATDGFSFAYLKELCVSAMVAWMGDRKPGSMGAIMVGMTTNLLSQMKSEPLLPAPTDEDDD